MKQSEIKAAVKKASKQVSKMTKAEKQKLEEEARRIIWQKIEDEEDDYSSDSGYGGWGHD